VGLASGGGREEDRCVDARVVYFDDCPCWRTAEGRLGEALTLVGRPEVPVTLVEVGSETEARVSAFAGSPTIVIDGVDSFPGSTVRTDGLACRLYPSPSGLAGAPTVDDLVAALRERI
jgi:hypothetical protein